ncbi:MAG: hypothetical protein HW387_1244 [Parachlamydiales bacterium]|nr:hypothetical protein [Parachlamydiales bacterium]
MIYSVIGLVGVGLLLIAFFLLQTGRVTSRGYLYSLLNLLGAVGILISLIDEWNLSAFVIEIAWILISIYGIIKCFHERKLAKK